MATREAKIRITATGDADKKIGDLATHGESGAHRLGAAFGKAGQAIGGDFGEIVGKISEGIDRVGESTGKLQKSGVAIAGVGAALTAIGEHEKIASQQLDQTIQSTGHDAEEFAGQIEGAVSSMEKYGYTADHTKAALQKLTEATRDPQKALDMMGEAADLAASKHISLESAADSLGKLLNGKGTRILAQYGIEVQLNADGTKNWDATNQKLAQNLQGQANASVTGFTGTLKHLRAEAEDFIAGAGQKYGPAITAIGVGMITIGPVAKGAASAVGSIGKRFLGSAVEAKVGAAGIATADEEIVAANEAAAASAAQLGESTAASKTGMLAGAGGLGVLGAAMAAFVIGGQQIAKAIDGTDNVVTEMETTFKSSKDAVDSLRESLINATGPTDKITEDWAKSAVQANGLAKEAAGANITIDQLRAAVTASPAEFDKLTSSWKKQGGTGEDVYAKLLVLNSGYNNVTTSVAQQRESSNQLSGAWSKTALTGSTLDDAIKGLSTDFDKLNSKTLDAERADIAAKDAIAAITAKTLGHSRSLSDNTAKGRANLSMVFDAITAAQQHAQAVLKQTGSVDKAKAAYDRDTTALGNHLDKLHFNSTAVQDLIDRYARMPKLKQTTVDLKDNASSKLDTLQSRLSQITGTRWTASIGASGDIQWQVTGGKGGGAIHFEAGGTGFDQGGPTMVAEREKEVILPRGAQVVPLSHLMHPPGSMLGGAAGGNAAVLAELKGLRGDLAGLHIVLDSGQLVGALSTKVGRLSGLYGRGG